MREIDLWLSQNILKTDEATALLLLRKEKYLRELETPLAIMIS
jgi:hypothetical protein